MTKEQLVALGISEEQAEKAAEASKEELKSYIPKARFDEVNDAKKKAEDVVKERDQQLETIKKDVGDNEDLKKQIEKLQTDNKEATAKHTQEMKDLQLNNAIKLAVAGKVHDEIVAATLFDKSKLVLSDDGKVIGLDEQVESMKKDKAYLFKNDEGNIQANQNQQQGNGFQVGAPRGGNNDNQQGNEQSLESAIAAHYSNQS